MEPLCERIVASAIGGLLAGLVSGFILVSWQRWQRLVDQDRAHLATIFASLSRWKTFKCSGYDHAMMIMGEVRREVPHLTSPIFRDVKNRILASLRVLDTTSDLAKRAEILDETLPDLCSTVNNRLEETESLSWFAWIAPWQ